VRLTDKALNATSPRWSKDGSVYFLAPKDSVAQIWRVGANGGAAQTETSYALDVNNFKLSPDGKLVAFAVRETDYDANKGKNGIWMVPAGGGKRFHGGSGGVEAADVTG